MQTQGFGGLRLGSGLGLGLRLGDSLGFQIVGIWGLWLGASGLGSGDLWLRV